MEIALNIYNEQIGKQILWMLEHFKNEGLEIKVKDDKFQAFRELEQKEGKKFKNVDELFADLDS